jgi:uncharacterized protein (DUF302 family)
MSESPDRRRILKALALGAAPAVIAAGPVRAQVDAGYRVVPSTLPFARLEEAVAAAIKAAGMNAVTRASASDGARGVTIRGDIVFGVFRNDFAVRMLAANVDAAIEAPVRLHLVEEPDGTTSIRYHLPSAVFGQYEGDAIKAIGRELDPIFAKIVAEAVAG